MLFEIVTWAAVPRASSQLLFHSPDCPEVGRCVVARRRDLARGGALIVVRMSRAAVSSEILLVFCYRRCPVAPVTCAWGSCRACRFVHSNRLRNLFTDLLVAVHAGLLVLHLVSADSTNPCVAFTIRFSLVRSLDVGRTSVFGHVLDALMLCASSSSFLLMLSEM